MRIKIKDAEIEVNDELGEQICSLIKKSVEESTKEPAKEPYKLIKWHQIWEKKIDKSRIQVGTQIDVGWASTPFVFDVVDINDGIYTLVSHYVVVDLPFDAPEPKNPNEDIMNCGSNDYLTSNIRQWLNIIDGAPVHFEPKAPYDTPFTNWDYIKPLSFKIYNSFLGATRKNSDGDNFWLLSEEEFQRIKFFEVKENRMKKDINGVPKPWWLGSPHKSNNRYVQCIWGSGVKSSDLVYNYNGVVPVCQIKL